MSYSILTGDADFLIILFENYYYDFCRLAQVVYRKVFIASCIISKCPFIFSLMHPNGYSRIVSKAKLEVLVVSVCLLLRLIMFKRIIHSNCVIVQSCCKCLTQIK